MTRDMKNGFHKEQVSMFLIRISISFLAIRGEKHWMVNMFLITHQPAFILEVSMVTISTGKPRQRLMEIRVRDGNFGIY